MKKRLLALSVMCTSIVFGGCSLAGSSIEKLPTDIESSTAENTTEDNNTTAVSSEKSTEEETVTEEHQTSEVVDITLNTDEIIAQTSDLAGIEVDYEYHKLEIEKRNPTIDENGNWYDYWLATMSTPYHVYWDIINDKRLNVNFTIVDMPVIYCEDEEAQIEINEILLEYILHDYTNRVEMLNVDFNLKCEVLNQTRFVSYCVDGSIVHTGVDDRYEAEREYRYYLNIDRMTGTVLNLNTVLDMGTVAEDIVSGNYEFIRGEEEVTARFTNELLAKTYLYTPLFADDMDHEYDFYIQDGKVCIVIWVGEEAGSYAILKLNSDPDIDVDPQRWEEEETLEEASDDETDEASEDDTDEASDDETDEISDGETLDGEISNDETSDDEADDA